MIQQWKWILPGTFLLIAVCVSGQTSAPTTSSAGAATPQIVFHHIQEALQHGDVNGAKEISLFDAGDDTVLEVLVRWSGTLAKLDAAGRARFGEISHNVSGYPMPYSDQALASTKFTIHGDTATATMGNASRPMRFVRISGQWWFDIRGAAKDENAKRLLPGMKATTEIAVQVASEIADGKYATADEARHAFEARRLEAVRQVAPAKDSPWQ